MKNILSKWQRIRAILTRAKEEVDWIADRELPYELEHVGNGLNEVMESTDRTFREYLFNMAREEQGVTHVNDRVLDGRALLMRQRAAYRSYVRRYRPGDWFRDADPLSDAGQWFAHCTAIGADPMTYTPPK